MISNCSLLDIIYLLYLLWLFLKNVVSCIRPKHLHTHWKSLNVYRYNIKYKRLEMCVKPIKTNDYAFIHLKVNIEFNDDKFQCWISEDKSNTAHISPSPFHIVRTTKQREFFSRCVRMMINCVFYSVCAFLGLINTIVAHKKNRFKFNVKI